MNKHQLADAYSRLTKSYSMRAAQRDNLDRSDDYLEIMQLVHAGKWLEVDALVQKNNYFTGSDPDDPVFEFVK